MRTSIGMVCEIINTLNNCGYCAEGYKLVLNKRNGYYCIEEMRTNGGGIGASEVGLTLKDAYIYAKGLRQAFFKA